jgi:hypothetical protein
MSPWHAIHHSMYPWAHECTVHEYIALIYSIWCQPLMHNSCPPTCAEISEAEHILAIDATTYFADFTKPICVRRERDCMAHAPHCAVRNGMHSTVQLTILDIVYHAIHDLD